MSAPPRTARGSRTRDRILAVATDVFAVHGYHDASIVKITEAADVAQGTFYLYFGSKQQIFEEVVRDLNSRVRRAMFEASSAEEDRRSAERAGFRAFFEFTARNPALYRVMRQAEFVAPDVLHVHYETIARGYITGLSAAQERGEVAADVDPEVAAWALMGIGELVGMRWVMWARESEQAAPEPASGAAPGAEPGAAVSGPPQLPDHVFDSVMHLVDRALFRGEAGTS